MKKRMNMVLLMCLVLTLVLGACSGGGTKTNNGQTNPSNNATNDPAAAETSEPVKDFSGNLEVWTFDDPGTKLLADAFMAKYPKVKITITNPGWNELPENLATTIAAGKGAPDVAYIEGGMFSRFNNSEGLEDLLQPPYDAGKYQGDFTEGNWQRWLSLDGEKLLGMPWDMPPMTTFYRPDLLEAAGYPTDPAELAEFIQSPDNVFEMGQALKAQGVYLFEWNNTPLDLITSKTGFFDRDFNYLRNNDELSNALDMVKKVKQLGLAMNQSAFWSDEGKAATSTGKLAMIFYGPWIKDQILGLGDDQKGKWKATALPFGINAGNGGSTMVIPSQSKNKELAYAFIEWSLTSMEANELWIKNGGTPGFIPAWDSPGYKETTYDLFGDQPVNVLFADLMGQVKESWVATPLNSAANKLWGEKITEAVDKNMDSKAALQQIQDDILKAVKVDMDKVKAELGK